MEHSMAQVSVCEGVRTGLEPYDNGMQLRYGADAGVLNRIEDQERCDGQSESSVDGMAKGYPSPCTSEGLPFSFCLRSINPYLALFPASQCAFRVFHGDPFYHKCSKEMTTLLKQSCHASEAFPDNGEPFFLER